jgi:subtilisin-like proprotein convertase family protein
VSSVIEVPETAASKKTYAKVKLTLDLEHTYKSDLRIALYTPDKKEVPVFGGEGGSTNDVRGTFELALPPGTKGAGAWRLVVSDHAALDAGTLESWKLQLVGAGAPAAEEAGDTPVFIPDAPENESDGGVAMFEIEPPRGSDLTARLGRVVASPAHAFARLEIDVAPELRPLPKRAQVVFVIDASHTMAPEGIDMQLAIARGYLAHVPDAQVEVVLYRRHATRLFGSFIAPADFAARVEAARKAGKLEPGNGSALDEGARLAATVLAGRSGPPRIVMVTDEILRNRWDNKLALAALKAAPPATVVHVVAAGRDDIGDPDDEGTLVRNDEHDLAPIALGHHGILVDLKEVPIEHKRMVPLVLGLVRPVQIDHFKITGLDLEHGDSDDNPPEVLREGSGVRIVVDSKDAPASVELSGMVWGDAYKKVVSVDAAFSRAAAGWVFAEDDHEALSDAEMMKVAMMGRAVSPVTSYLAIEPGVRPSTIGLVRSGYGVGSGRGGMSPRVAMGMASRVRKKPDPRELMTEAIKACVKKHAPPAGWKVRLGIETTLDEVVDVQIEAGASLAVAPCLLEAAWAMRLSGEYTLGRETFSVEISYP